MLNPERLVVGQHEYAKWLSCDQVPYYGGLCEHAITADSTRRLFDGELDLQGDVVELGELLSDSSAHGS
jgi:hypothetical protein